MHPWLVKFGKALPVVVHKSIKQGGSETSTLISRILRAAPSAVANFLAAPFIVPVHLVRSILNVFRIQYVLANLYKAIVLLIFISLTIFVCTCMGMFLGSLWVGLSIDTVGWMSAIIVALSWAFEGPIYFGCMYCTACAILSTGLALSSRYVCENVVAKMQDDTLD